MKFRALIVASILFAPLAANADVEIEAVPLREYQLPFNFAIQTASVVMGPDQTTYLYNTLGDAADSRCGVIIATDEDATLFEYTFDDSPTACTSILPHPDGGFFARVVDPNAQDGDVTGATALIDGDGREVWKVPDRQLVDARDQPQGPGEFLGNYVTTIQPLLYSQSVDRLLGFTIGKITLGFDEKFIGQSHLINVETGFLGRNGLTFGQAGVGFPADGLIKEDGQFLIRYFLNGQQGADFFNYDGRNDISLFEPGDDDWSQRWVWRMRGGDRTVHLLWTETDEPTEPTMLTVTNENGDVFYEVEYENFYRFRDGETVQFGLPTNMWVTGEYSVIAYVLEDSIYLRLVDENGESPGMARLNGVTDDPALGLVEGPEGLRLLTFNFVDNEILEYRVEFEDVAEFDPDAGFGDTGVSIDLGTGTLVDVLDEVGCACRTVAHRAASQPLLALAFAGLFGILWRRKRQ